MSVDRIEPGSQFRDIERLFHNARNLELPVFIFLDGPRVSGQHDDISGKTPIPEPPHEIESGNPDHLMIGNDHIESRPRLVEYFKRLVAVLRKNGLMPGQLKNGGQRRAATSFIVNDQDIQRFAAWWGCVQSYLR